jgi:hypothetical protein
MIVPSARAFKGEVVDVGVEITARFIVTGRMSTSRRRPAYTGHRNQAARFETEMPVHQRVRPASEGRHELAPHPVESVSIRTLPLRFA